MPWRNISMPYVNALQSAGRNTGACGMPVKVMTTCTKGRSSFSSMFSPGQIVTFQSAITCSKLTIETLEQGVKYVQS